MSHAAEGNTDLMPADAVSAAAENAGGKENSQTSIDPREVERFVRMAEEWWDPRGKFRPLHKFNPARLAYIRDKICLAFDRDPKGRAPLADIRILDIGCGGGLLCEPLARLGADIIGIDAAAANIETAKIHAEQSGAQVDYRVDTAENMAVKGERFDAVLNMEVVEHVANAPFFMQAAASLVQPRGLMFTATLNRTLKAWALAIIGAEYALRWLPKGTHDYNRFLQPQELETLLLRGGLTIIDKTGVTYSPCADMWRLSDDMSVNYMLLARRLP